MDQSFTQAIYESCETFESDEESISLDNLEELKQNLNIITLDDGLLWSSDDSVHFHIQNWKMHYYIRCCMPTLTIDPHTLTFLTQILLRYSIY